MPETTVFKGPEWIPLAEAAQTLGRSERSLQRLAASGAIRKNDGGLYSSHDIVKARSENLPAPRERDRTNSIDLPAFISERIDQHFQKLESALLAPPAPPAPLADWPDVPLHQKLWLTLAEAEAYSGLAKSDLRQLARQKLINARRSGRRLVIERLQLERFAG